MIPEENEYKHIQADLFQSIQKIFHSDNLAFFYSWSKEEQKWLQTNKLLNPKKTSQDILKYLKENSNYKEKEIISVTLNVLFDFRGSDQPDKDRGHMKFSSQRYQAILNELQKKRPHIVTLNQVTKPFVKMIQEKHWIRQSYKISTIHQSNQIRCFGNIILTRLNPFALHVYKVPSLPRPISIGFFSFNGINEYKIVTFSSIHLTAYEQNIQRRQKQLISINQYLKNYDNAVSQHIFQGDMNFHSQIQNSLSQHLKLKDCWLFTHNIKNLQELKNNAGYTFDSEKNFFIKQLYWGFEKRRMRLDRIFSSTHNKNILIPKEMKVIFDKPIFQTDEQPRTNILKGALQYVGDKLKLNLFRKKSKYLFCSDHFGLECLFTISN